MSFWKERSPDVRRSPRYIAGRLVLAGGLLVVAACSDSGSSPSTASTAATAPATAAPASTPETAGRSDVTTTNGNSVEVKNLSFPGRAVLSVAACESATGATGSLWEIQDGKVLLVVDARLSYPKDCDPATDSGAGTYAGASYDAPVQKRADGSTHIPDGTVVAAEAFARGEFACSVAGGSTVWVDVIETEGGAAEWVPGINASYPALDFLLKYGVPEVESEYAGSKAAGC